MKNMILKWLISKIDLDSMSKIFATLIANLISYARSHASEEGWTTTKNIISKLNVWTSLFVQAYEDDTLTPEEEELIAQAIRNTTTAESIYSLIQKSSQNDSSETKSC